MRTFHSTQPVDLLPGDERQIDLIGLGIHTEGLRGGFVWQRPWAVEVRQGGTTRRLRIPDATLRAQLVIWLTALVLGGLLWWLLSARRLKQ